jgi:type I restriction enzyme S subunit
MSSERRIYTLDEITTLITDGKHGDCQDLASSGYYFLSVKDVKGDRLNYEQARQIAQKDFEETHRRTNLEPGDILFTNTGTIGRMAIAPANELTRRTTFQKSVAILKPRANIVTSKYLFYLLKAENGRLSAFAEGTTQKNLLLKDFRSFEIGKLPPIEDQKAIAHILGTLDDKIELNRKTNETLEAMAKALFKSWFVDFDPVRAKAEGRPTGLPAEISDLFPDSFEDSELGEIPRGWEVKALDEIAHFLNGLALQKFPPEEGGATLPVIKIAQLKKGDSTGADRCSTSVPAEYVVRDGDVLFSWSGSLAVDIWSGGDGALNQHLFKVTSKTYGKWFIYQWVMFHLPVFQEIAQGKATTMGHIQRHHLSEAKALLPESSLLAAMDSVFSPLLDRVFGLRRQSIELSSIRDALLPKLISGELRIPDAEKLLEEAGI